MLNRKKRLFETKVLPLRSYLYRFALKLLGNKEEAEDLVQETMFKALEKWETFDYKSDNGCKSWVTTILTNMFINLYKTKMTQLRVFEEQTNISIINKSMKRLEPEKQLYKKQLYKDINSAMNTLPDKLKLSTILFLIDNKSYQEIADITEEKINTVKTRIYRGKQRLQKELEKYRY